MEEGLVKPDFRVHCPGGAFFYGRWFQCHLKGGHGSVDMRHAIEKSCNTYFYTLGNMLGVDRIHKWATALGLGQINGIDLPNELPGLVPSTEWKRREKKEKWYAGETISVAIGQGQVNVTPMSQAVMMMTLANGGTRYTPHVLKAIDKGKGWEPFAPPPPRSAVHMKDSTDQGGSRRVVAGGQWRRHRRTCPHRRGRRRRARPARPSPICRSRPRGVSPGRWKPGTMAGSSSSHRATTPKSPG